MVAGAGDDASPLPNFDKSPACTGNPREMKLIRVFKICNSEDEKLSNA